MFRLWSESGLGSRMGDAGRQHVIDRFSLQGFSLQLEKHITAMKLQRPRAFCSCWMQVATLSILIALACILLFHLGFV